MSVSFTNGSSFETALPELFGAPTSMEVMCSFQDKVFVAGNFDIAGTSPFPLTVPGNVPVPQNIAIYSGGSWQSIALQNLPRQQACQSCVSCTHDTNGNLFVAYLYESKWMLFDFGSVATPKSNNIHFAKTT